MAEKKQLRVFISSPGDVEEERRRAALVLGRLKRDFQRFFDVSSMLWEYEPLLSSGHFQDCIVEPSVADIVIVILWSRLGTPLPEKTPKREYRGLDGRAPVTGTEWEYEDALKAARALGTPDLLVYRKDVPGEARGASSTEMEQAVQQMRSLEVFWERHFQTREGQFVAAHHRFTSLDQFETMLEGHLHALLTARANRQRAGEGEPLTWAGCPFRGLQSFEIEHAAVFFGRGRAEREVTEQLARQAARGQSFVLVLGASGCGKSSLVKAGVVPNILAPGVIAGVESWRHAVFRPAGEGGDIFDRLAAKLVGDRKALPELARILSAAEIAALFRRGEGAETVKQALGGAARLILVIDQLEELFTAVPETERRTFGALLARLAASRAVWIVASMRSDFFHRLPSVPALHELTPGDGLYHLGPAKPEEIEQMIRLPAEAAGLSFDVDNDGVGLDARLAAAAVSSPDALPLLEFTLERLYHRDIETIGGRFLTSAGYAALGGLEGAIAAHADAAVAAMSDAAKSALPPVLLTMVSLEGDTVTARPARQKDVASDSARAAALDALVAARLVAVREGVTGEPMVAPAHEALLNHWPRLQEIIAMHRDFLRARQRVEAQGELWRSEGSDPSRLLAPGNPLADGETLLEHPLEIEPWLADYVKRSHAHVRRGQQRRMGIVAAVFLMLGGVGFGAYEAASRLVAYEARRTEEAHRSDIAGSIYAYATSPGGLAMDLSDPTQRNGTYTSALLRHISNARLSVNEIFVKAHAEVVEDARKAKFQQQPTFSTSLNGEIFLQDPPSSRRTFAFVVGVSDYLNVPKLQNPINDARDLGAAFKNMGIDTTVLLDADTATLKKALTELEEKIRAVPHVPKTPVAAPSDNHRGFVMQPMGLDYKDQKAEDGPANPNSDVVVILYFSGQGLEISGKNYFVPRDAPMAYDPDPSHWFDVGRVVSRIGRVAAVQIAIFDICRDNPFTSLPTR